MEEGDITAQTFEPLTTTGATQTERWKSRSGFLWSGPPETVGMKKLSDVHCLRASCGATVSPRDSGRKARCREEKEAGGEIGAGKCSVSTARSTGLRHQQLREE